MSERTYVMPTSDEIMVDFGWENGEEVVTDIYAYNDCHADLIRHLVLTRPSRRGSPFIHSTDIEKAWKFVQEFAIDFDVDEEE